MPRSVPIRAARRFAGAMLKLLHSQTWMLLILLRCHETLKRLC